MAITPRSSWQVFDQIAPRYDLLNRLLSLRQDVLWRKAVCRKLPGKKNLQIVDLATGTGDLAITIAKSHPTSSIIGMDLSSEMLVFAEKKIKSLGLKKRITLQKGDAAEPDLPPNTFDAVTIAFGIRNTPDPEAVLRAMKTLLKPGGKALVLEFSTPTSRLFRLIFLAYFRHILPKIGGLISGHSEAYHYLNQSAEKFPYGQAFADWMRNAGFSEVAFRPLSFGIATLYWGTKP